MMKIRADRRIGLLLGGVLLLAFVSIGATVALPAADPAVSKKQEKLTAQQVRGAELYKSEGFATANFNDAALLRAFLADPDEPAAGIPSFEYLSEDAREALVAYVRTRK